MQSHYQIKQTPNYRLLSLACVPPPLLPRGVTLSRTCLIQGWKPSNKMEETDSFIITHFVVTKDDWEWLRITLQKISFKIIKTNKISNEASHVQSTFLLLTKFNLRLWNSNWSKFSILPLSIYLLFSLTNKNVNIIFIAVQKNNYSWVCQCHSQMYFSTVCMGTRILSPNYLEQDL